MGGLRGSPLHKMRVVLLFAAFLAMIFITTAKANCDYSPGGEFFRITGPFNCLKLYNDHPRSWFEAESKCKSHGFRIAQPTDFIVIALRKYIRDNYNYEGATWLGARSDGHHMSWFEGNQSIVHSKCGNDDFGLTLWRPGFSSDTTAINRCLIMTTNEIYPGQPYMHQDCSTFSAWTLCEKVV